MDSDLAESLAALRDAFEKRGVALGTGQADPELVEALKSKFRIPRRYREFLLAADPLDLETRTPTERVRLFPASRLEEEQREFSTPGEGSPSNGWRPTWVAIAHSTLLGDPYFLDVGSTDAEGDCPVYTAMSGTEHYKPRLCASSFATFLRILAIGMDLAKGFSEDDVDMDDEQVFRESLGPRIREYDPAALKAGHWT